MANFSMMHTLNGLPLSRKLGVMLAFPVIGVVMLSIGAGLDRYMTYAEMGRVSSLVGLVGRVSAFVHHVQRERGMTAAYLASGGEAFSEALRDGREATGVRLDELQRYVGVAALVDTFPALAADLTDAMRGAEDLPELREAVDGSELTAGQAVDRYSAVVGRFLDVVDILPRFSTEGHLSHLLSSYTQLLEAQEYAGIERALMGEVAVADRVDEGQRERIRSLIRIQQSTLAKFERTAPQPIVELYRRQRADTSFAQVEGLERRVLNADKTRGFGLGAEQWYAIATQRIDGLSRVDTAIREGIRTTADSLRDQARLFFLSVIGLVVTGLLLTLYFALRITGCITTQTGNLLSALQDLADGRLERRVPVLTTDEVGQISESVNLMARRLQDMTERERTQHQDEQRRARRFHETVDQVREKLRLIAFGDLTQKIPTPEDDEELEQLVYNVNMMTNGLRELARGMISATEEMAESMAQLGDATQSQAAAAAQQASAANETVTTLEELRAISSQTREKAQALGDAADRAMHEGEAGRTRVAHSRDGMGLIRDRVSAIGGQIQALNDRVLQIEGINAAVANVAQQSKMLALNAAIEAAKAGAAGRGFAAVAAEVKTLAEQSGRDTLQVERILHDVREATENAVREIEEGAREIVEALRSVDETGQTLARLSDVAQETAIASKQIVAAVRQESTGIEQLATAVNEINDATGQFAETTRQTESASKNLARITRVLQEHAGVYEV